MNDLCSDNRWRIVIRSLAIWFVLLAAEGIENEFGTQKALDYLLARSS
jgi:hypothetical protein